MLSRQSLDILIDLVEIKLSAILVQDKDDMREVRKLKICKSELLSSKKDLNKMYPIVSEEQANVTT